MCLATHVAPHIGHVGQRVPVFVAAARECKLPDRFVPNHKNELCTRWAGCVCVCWPWRPAESGATLLCVLPLLNNVWHIVETNKHECISHPIRGVIVFFLLGVCVLCCCIWSGVVGCVQIPGISIHMLVQRVCGALVCVLVSCGREHVCVVDMQSRIICLFALRVICDDPGIYVWKGQYKESDFSA